MLERIRRFWAVLNNPEKEFAHVRTRTLEAVLEDYLKVLILLAVVTALVDFLFFAGRSVYANYALGADVVYLRMLNYALGRAMVIGFFYLFAGTIFVFAISAVLRLLFRRVKYTMLLKVVLVALAPFLLFGWVPMSVALPLGVWSIVLFVHGIRQAGDVQVSRESIAQRD